MNQDRHTEVVLSRRTLARLVLAAAIWLAVCAAGAFVVPPQYRSIAVFRTGLLDGRFVETPQVVQDNLVAQIRTGAIEVSASVSVDYFENRAQSPLIEIRAEAAAADDARESAALVLQQIATRHAAIYDRLRTMQQNRIAELDQQISELTTFLESIETAQVNFPKDPFLVTTRVQELARGRALLAQLLAARQEAIEEIASLELFASTVVGEAPSQPHPTRKKAILYAIGIWFLGLAPVAFFTLTGRTDAAG